PTTSIALDGSWQSAPAGPGRLTTRQPLREPRVADRLALVASTTWYSQGKALKGPPPCEQEATMPSTSWPEGQPIAQGTRLPLALKMSTRLPPPARSST